MKRDPSQVPTREAMLIFWSKLSVVLCSIGAWGLGSESKRGVQALETKVFFDKTKC